MINTGLNTIDVLIIIAFLVSLIWISWRVRTTANQGLEGFFLGGKNLPWYLAGISMVATTFAADTPLLVTELTVKYGVSGNWFWWCYLAGGVLTAIFFAAYWRRAGIITEAEFITLRYSGAGAKFLRYFKAFYLGLFMNVIIIAWVNKAFLSLIEVYFNWPAESYFWPLMGVLIGTQLFIAIFTSISGLKGVVYTDVLQFILAMVGCIILAVIVVKSPEVGGITGLKEKLPQSSFEFWPSLGDSPGKTMGLLAFFGYVGVIWWSSWYPGAEPGGGGYIAQRIMSTKSEKDATLSTLLYQLAHYGIRPWPWIIVALCSAVLYPELSEDNIKLGYVMAMKDFLPIGINGIMLAGFLGAYISTISTQLNWGASYLVNDVILPLKKNTDEKKAPTYGRWVTFGITAIAIAVTPLINTIQEAWAFVMECGAGLGLVLILRWFWHRINVWSEISATLSPFVFYAISKWGLELAFPNSLFLTVGGTTIVWLVVTFLTPPVKKATLENFYLKIRPIGFWKVKKQFQNPESSTLIKARTKKEDLNLLMWNAIAWMGGIAMVYGFLFCIGNIIFMNTQGAIQYGISCIVGLFVLNFGGQRAGLF